MPRMLRYLIELHDPYVSVLCDLAHAHERTHQQQTTWIVKRYLDSVIHEQEKSLDTFLDTDPRLSQEVAHE